MWDNGCWHASASVAMTCCATVVARIAMHMVTAKGGTLCWTTWVTKKLAGGMMQGPSWASRKPELVLITWKKCEHTEMCRNCTPSWTEPTMKYGHCEKTSNTNLRESLLHQFLAWYGRARLQSRHFRWFCFFGLITHSRSVFPRHKTEPKDVPTIVRIWTSCMSEPLCSHFFVAVSPQDIACFSVCQYHAYGKRYTTLLQMNHQRHISSKARPARNLSVATCQCWPSTQYLPLAACYSHLEWDSWIYCLSTPSFWCT